MRRIASAVVAAAFAVALVASFQPRPAAPVPFPAPAAHAAPPPRARPELRPTPPPGARPKARPRAAPPEPRPAPRLRRRSAVGVAVRTPFGVVQVRATLTGRRLTAVDAVALRGETVRSDFIDQQAEPILRREALRAQSARIDAVSGATWTSEGYKRSLRSALERARAARPQPAASGT